MRGELRPSLRLDTGYASDLFMGSGYGPHASGDVAPGISGALSTGARLKLFGSYRLEYGRSGESASRLGHAGSLCARLRIFRFLDLDATSEAESTDFSTPVAPRPGFPASLAFRSIDWGPVLRARLGESTLELSWSAERQVSVTEQGELPETQQELSVSWTYRPTPAVELGTSLRGWAADSPFEGLVHRGRGAGLSAIAVAAEDLLVRSAVDFRWSRYSEGDILDRILMLELGAIWSPWDELSLELSGTLGELVSQDPDRDGERRAVILSAHLERVLRW